ncbi:MAG: flavodoxin-dependent (E)-4-hydroxy-3-methylbut-2-enyl-diphosphate synthase [Candidatus Omnitrophota bacterium]
MIARRKTRQIKVGNVKIGGFAPVSIQSMTKVDTSDIRAVVGQIKRLEKSGCEIVRVAIKDLDDARAVKEIKKKIGVPIVCDIHFNYRLALESIRSGADKIRLNPGNIRKMEEVGEVVRAAKKAKIPIRIGINSGSLFTRNSQRATHNALVDSALQYIKVFEELDFHDIIISLKASDVRATVEAYKRMAKLSDYPLHLGITASGPYDSGIVKSAIGIGALLLDGIGDTVRVSLTADPVEEVTAARRILSSLGLKKSGPEIISCPTCGRCQVDLGAIVKEFEYKLSALDHGPWTKRPFKVAIMGCEVNGPGEAREADIGIAFGAKNGMIFKKGKILKKVAVKNAVIELLKNL